MGPFESRELALLQLLGSFQELRSEPQAEGRLWLQRFRLGCLLHSCFPHHGSRGFWSLLQTIADGLAMPSTDRRARLLSAEH